MLADEVDHVVGVDTHRDQHVLAIVVAATGAVVAQRSLSTNARGYAAAVRFAEAFAPGARVWAVEGAGHYGAGLVRFLSARGELVSESGRSTVASSGCAARTTRSTQLVPPARHSRAKQPTPPRAGERQEPLRLLLLTRRSTVDVRRVALVQLRSVIVTAPEGLRAELRRLPVGELLQRCSRFRRSSSRTPDQLATILVLRPLAQRIQAATQEAAQLEREILTHCRRSRPTSSASPASARSSPHN